MNTDGCTLDASDVRIERRQIRQAGFSYLIHAREREQSGAFITENAKFAVIAPNEDLNNMFNGCEKAMERMRQYFDKRYENSQYCDAILHMADRPQLYKQRIWTVPKEAKCRDILVAIAGFPVPCVARATDDGSFQFIGPASLTQPAVGSAPWNSRLQFLPIVLLEAWWLSIGKCCTSCS